MNLRKRKAPSFAEVLESKKQKIDENNECDGNSDTEENDELLDDNVDDDLESDPLYKIISRLKNSKSIIDNDEWKDGLSNSQIEDLEIELTAIKNMVNFEKPTLQKILLSNLSSQSKKKCIELLEIMEEAMPTSTAYIASKELINKHLTFSGKVPKNLSDQYTNIVNFLREKVPTLEKILGNTNLLHSDKIRCVELYERMLTTDPYGDEYYYLEKQINEMLKSSNTKYKINNLDKLEKTLELENISNLKHQILSLNACEHNISVIYKKYKQTQSYSPSSDSYKSTKTWLNYALAFPYGKYSSLSCVDFKKVWKSLNSNLYKMSPIKERLMETIVDKKRGVTRSKILCLAGKPGLGKTSICKVFADALSINYAKIHVGSMTDSGILRGSDSVWLESKPSLLVRTLSRFGSLTGVIILEEIDKLSTSVRGFEVQDALLEILDPEQNSEFGDTYLSELKFDLSDIIFIATANDVSKLSSPLKDRLDIIEVPEYTREQKVEMLKTIILPKSLKEYKFTPKQIIFNKGAISTIISLSSTDSIRSIRKNIDKILSKVGLAIETKNMVVEDVLKFPITVTSELVQKYCSSENKVHNMMFV